MKSFLISNKIKYYHKIPKNALYLLNSGLNAEHIIDVPIYIKPKTEKIQQIINEDQYETYLQDHTYNFQ